MQRCIFFKNSRFSGKKSETPKKTGKKDYLI